MKKSMVSCAGKAAVLSLGCLLSACATHQKSDEVKQQVATTKASSTEEKKEMNIVTSPSGLKREVLKAAPADAKKPTKGQKVTVHYTGWLDDNGKLGTKFDSSVDRGQAFTFIVGVGQVIKGWDEGVMAMSVGEKCRLTIPADLGYGSRGAGAIIKPNSTLIFDVELLSLA